MPATDRCCVATVLTACGIETSSNWPQIFSLRNKVATVLTACGIETSCHGAKYGHTLSKMLQQCLPLAVLKLDNRAEFVVVLLHSCNSAYRLRYWNAIYINRDWWYVSSCNSAYRLRYWNETLPVEVVSFIKLQQCLPLAVLKQIHSHYM